MPACIAEPATECPATATDLAARLPITRQGIAEHPGLLAEAGQVIAEAVERCARGTDWAMRQ